MAISILSLHGKATDGVMNEKAKSGDDCCGVDLESKYGSMEEWSGAQ